MSHPPRPVSTVAIIGAGWSGLQIAAVLRQHGLEVTIYEALDDVGGTWHPDSAYVGLAIHTPAFRSRFADFDNYVGHAPLDRLPSAEVFENCCRFADAKGLRPAIRCRHVVEALHYDSRRHVNRLTVRQLATGDAVQAEFDFVVSTQFNVPRMPSLPGCDAFGGEVLHANAVKAEAVARWRAEGRRVVLLGGSKSAADIALALLDRGLPFTWVLRRMYWFLSYDWGYYDLRRQRRPSRLYRWLYFLGLGLSKGPRSNRMVFDVWRRTGLLQCPGEPHDDYTKFHHGWLDERQMEALRTRTTQQYDEVEGLDAHGVVTRSGRRLPCDVLICATGCDPMQAAIPLQVDGRPIDYRAVEHVYRYSVIPALPRLCFTGYAMFGFGPLNGYHRAAWILQFIEQQWTSEALQEAAARESAETGSFMFRRGSFLFDSSGDLLLIFKRMNALLGRGLYSGADVRRHYFDVAVRHVYAPLAGVAAFLSGRRR